MANYQSADVQNTRPSITPDGSGELYCVRGQIANPATLGVGDTLELVKLPADCVVTDFTLDIDKVDANASPTLAASVGFVAVPTGAPAATGAEFRAAAAMGGTAGGSVVRMDSVLASRLAPFSGGERTVGLKVTTAAATVGSGVVGLTLYYRQAHFGA